MEKMHNELTWKDAPAGFDRSIWFSGICLVLLISIGVSRAFIYASFLASSMSQIESLQKSADVMILMLFSLLL